MKRYPLFSSLLLCELKLEFLHFIQLQRWATAMVLYHSFAFIKEKYLFMVITIYLFVPSSQTILFWVGIWFGKCQQTDSFRSCLMRVNNTWSCHDITYNLPYLPFLDKSNPRRHQWNLNWQLTDDKSTIIGSLKFLTIWFRPSKRCSNHLFNKIWGFEKS